MDESKQSALFKVTALNLSESINRNQSNGIFFFLRYQDGENLYYAGIRVDGTSVIKKKINGEYFTLAQKQILESKDNDRNDKKYDRENSPSLIPLDTWFGIKAEIQNEVQNNKNSVSIKFFVSRENKDNEWELVLKTTDSPNDFDHDPILLPGHAGLRTNFMDVKFKNFKIMEK